jgi:hypothetical protein
MVTTRAAPVRKKPLDSKLWPRWVTCFRRQNSLSNLQSLQGLGADRVEYYVCVFRLFDNLSDKDSNFPLRNVSQPVSTYFCALGAFVVGDFNIQGRPIEGHCWLRRYSRSVFEKAVSQARPANKTDSRRKYKTMNGCSVALLSSYENTFQDVTFHPPVHRCVNIPGCSLKSP